MSFSVEMRSADVERGDARLSSHDSIVASKSMFCSDMLLLGLDNPGLK